jgi:xanthine/uracil permease
MNGVSKKLTVSGIGIAALVSIVNEPPSKLSYFVAAGIALITLLAITAQTYLDRKP